MPALIDIRRRIRSVKNTEQITKAMAFSAVEAFLLSASANLVRARRSMTPRPERGRG